MRTNQAEFYRGLEAASGALANAKADADGGAAPLAIAVHDAVTPLLTADAASHACRAGCAACCHFPVGVTFAEAQRLAAAIAAEARLVDRVLAEADASEPLAWPQLVGRPCPLLLEGRCRRHEARPLPCRALASRDAAACERALTAAVEVPRDEAASWRGLGAGAALASAGPVHGHRELRAALAAVLRHPAAAAAAFLAARAAPGS